MSAGCDHLRAGAIQSGTGRRGGNLVAGEKNYAGKKPGERFGFERDWEYAGGAAQEDGDGGDGGRSGEAGVLQSDGVVQGSDGAGDDRGGGGAGRASFGDARGGVDGRKYRVVAGDGVRDQGVSFHADIVGRIFGREAAHDAAFWRRFGDFYGSGREARAGALSEDEAARGRVGRGAGDVLHKPVQQHGRDSGVHGNWQGAGRTGGRRVDGVLGRGGHRGNDCGRVARAEGGWIEGAHRGARAGGFAGADDGERRSAPRGGDCGGNPAAALEGWRF